MQARFSRLPIIATALFLTLQVLQSLQFMKNDFLFRDFYYILFLNVITMSITKKAKSASFICAFKYEMLEHLARIR